MNNINENLEPVKEIVQNQNIVENQQIEELKRENEGIFKDIINEYLSAQCEKMKKNNKLKKLLENIKILKEKIYGINFKNDIFKEDAILRKEWILLKELKDFILSYLKILRGDNIFKIAEKYESKEEFKEEERSDYEFVDELYRKLKNLQGFYEFVLEYFKDYEKEDILKNREMFEKEFVDKIKKEKLKVEPLNTIKEEDFNNNNNIVEIVEDGENVFLYDEEEGYDENWENLNKLFVEAENKLLDVESYGNAFTNSLFDFVNYFYDSYKVNVKPNQNEEEEVNVYAKHNIKRKDMKNDDFLRMYIELKKELKSLGKIMQQQINRVKKNIERKSCYEYNLDRLNYVIDTLNKEKEKLKYLFSYLENLVKLINLHNIKDSKNKIDFKEYFNLNNEFKDSFNPNSEEAFLVKFKYDLHDVMDFCRREVEEIEKMLTKNNSRIEKYKEIKVRVRNYKTNVVEYKKVRAKNLIIQTIERNIKQINKSYITEIEPILKNLESEFKDNLDSKKLINLIRILFELINLKKSYINNFLSAFKNAQTEQVEGVLKIKTPYENLPEKYEEVLDPELSDMAFRIMNDQIEEIAKIKEFNKFILNYLKEKKLDTNDFVNDVFKLIANEFKNIEKEPIEFKNFFNIKKYPAIMKTFEDYNWNENENENNDANLIIDDAYFNEIFEKIENLVNEYGELKHNNSNISNSNNSFLNLLYKKLEDVIDFNIDKFIVLLNYHLNYYS